jgi:hypothetical protein
MVGWISLEIKTCPLFSESLFELMREQRFLWFGKDTLIQHPSMLAIAAPMYALTGAPDEALPRHSHRVFFTREDAAEDC